MAVLFVIFAVHLREDCNRLPSLRPSGGEAFLARMGRSKLGRGLNAEFPFNREQYMEFATRLRAELMASIAFHAGLFRYSRRFRQIRSGIYQGSVPG